MPRPHYAEGWISESPADAVSDGTTRAETLLLKLNNGTSDPEAVLRSLLDVVAESGRIIPPDSRLRGWCSRLQQHIKNRK